MSVAPLSQIAVHGWCCVSRVRHTIGRSGYVAAVYWNLRFDYYYYFYYWLSSSNNAQPW
jgi:hypothetical protein